MEDTRSPIETLTRRQLVGAGAAGLALGLPLLRAHDGLAAPASQALRRGGRLRVAVAGAIAAETLDPHRVPRPVITIARTHQLFEGLFDFSPSAKPVPVLASDWSANPAGTVWRIKIKRGVEFHNGKTLTARDVAYSLRRVRDPGLATESKNDLYFLPVDGIRAVDATTLELRLDQPIGDITDKLASRGLGVVPDGWTDFAAPVGTGPFRFGSFTPGQRSLFLRHPNYRVSGRPLLDELEIIRIDDTVARLNALRAGQVDAIAAVDQSQLASLRREGFKILASRSGGFIANFMNVTQPPFNNERVRLAVRLLHDRKAMVNTILRGQGVVGNDLPMRFDPLYASEIRQIAFDPERALSLLRRAGLGDRPELELQTSSRFPGFLESATLFQQTAAKAGVKINLKVVSADSYYTRPYLAHPFTQSLWFQRSLDLFFLQALDSRALFPETGFKSVAFDNRTRAARATRAAKKRRDLYVAAQRNLWSFGGYVMWAHPNVLDAYSARFGGFVPSTVTNLGWFTFDTVGRV